MLRITVQSDPAAAKSYFTQATHDYLVDGGKAPPGVWGGKGAEMLGLSGEIRQEDWDRLCDNLHPQTGERLTAAQRAHRRIFYDLTYSMPKSASVASLFDPRVVPAFREAVAAANDLVERDLAARVRVGGADEDRITGNAVVGSYLHRESRPVNGVSDVHVHLHCAVFNATFDAAEGKWKAAQLGQIKADAGYYEQVMLSHFAQGLRTLGYGIRRKGRYFEIEGVPESVVDKFSARRDLLHKLADARGLTDPAAKGELAAKVRERKNRALTEDQLVGLWKGRLTAAETALLTARPGQQAPLPTVDESVAHALAHVFEAEAVATEKKVYEHALMHGVGSATLDALRTALPAAGLLTKGGLATTAVMLKLEREVLDAARFGRGTCAPLHPRYRPSPTLRLSRGQRDAVRLATTSPDRYLIVRGGAGTGKTTALAEIARAAREAGTPLLAAAVTHTATEELAKEVDPGAVTVARFLLDPAARERVRGGLLVVDEASTLGVRDLHRLTRAVERLGARCLLVGDKKQHGAVTAGSPFTLLQQRAGLAAAEIIEIRRQKPPLYKAAVERLAADREAEALSLLEQMGWVREAAAPERMREIAGDYLEAVVQGKSVLCVAPTNAECAAVTTHIRVALKRHGLLGTDDRAFERLVPLHLTEAERADPHAIPEGTVARFVKAKGGYEKHQRADARQVAGVRKLADAWAAYRPDTLHLAVGDRLRTTAGTADVAGHRLANNTRLTVTGFTRTGVRVRTVTGLDRTLSAAAAAVLAHDYATTSYSAQGRTVDRVIVSEPAATLAAAGKQQVYVSASRARHECYVYTDDLAALREAAARDKTKRNATDLIAPHPPKPVPRPNPVRARVSFLQRARQVAAAVGARVRHLTQRKEVGYEYGG